MTDFHIERERRRGTSVLSEDMPPRFLTNASAQGLKHTGEQQTVKQNAPRFSDQNNSGKLSE